MGKIHTDVIYFFTFLLVFLLVTHNSESQLTRITLAPQLQAFDS